MRRTFTVYVRTDEAGRITSINSSAFLTDLTGWTAIAEGSGDRFHHAQGNYLPRSVLDDRGVHRYKLLDGQVWERTQEEMDADYEAANAEPSTQERIAELEEALELLLSGVTE